MGNSTRSRLLLRVPIFPHFETEKNPFRCREAAVDFKSELGGRLGDIAAAAAGSSSSHQKWRERHSVVSAVITATALPWSAGTRAGGQAGRPLPLAGWPHTQSLGMEDK